jgi:hypothetical protein
LNLELPPAQIADIVRGARADLVERLFTEHADELALVSAAQAAGILDVTMNTLRSLPIPRVVIVTNKVIKYRVTDLREYIASRTER